MSTAFDAAHDLHLRGELDAAASGYERVLSESPGDFQSAYYLSLLRAQQGRLDDALALARRAAGAEPDSADAHAHLGAVLLTMSRHGEAIDELQRAVALRPEAAAAHNNLGSAYYTLGRTGEAADAYRRAIELDPRFSDAHNNLGTLLREIGRFDDAVEHFEMAPAFKPDSANAHADLAHVLLEMGRLDEAAAAFERAIALAPRQPSTYRALASIKPFAADSPHLAALEALALDEESFSCEDRIALHFALGTALAGVGRHEESFRHFIAGNALHRATLDYDEAGTLESFANIAAVFSAQRMSALAGEGDPSAGPVFILGMPRSGSTLVEQILASHPGVYAAGELPYLQECVDAVFTRGGAPLDAEHLRRLGSTYVARVRALAPFAARITDKMPANFRFAGLIALALPNARIVHTRRDPVDNCLSCFSILFADGQEFTYDLAELGRYYRGYEALADHWRSVVGPEIWLDVQYEDVVADVEAQARRIVAHCGLPWTDACLAFHKTKRPVQTASASQVRKPIYKSSIGRWRPYAPLLAPLLDALGVNLSS